MNRDSKVKEFEPQRQNKFKRQQDIEQQRFQTEVPNCKSSNIITQLNTFPIYNPT